MQQINLYQAQFKPKHIVLPARQVLLLALLAIVIFIVMAFYSAKKNTTLEAYLATQEQLSTPEQQSIPVDKLTLLQVDLTQLQQQQTQKQRLLDYLTYQTFGNQQGFSHNLLHLSQQRIKGVWLTEFSFLNAGNHISLQGSALQSSRIPLYIDSLAESGPFEGKHFSVFSLQNPDDDSALYTFKLHTDSNNNEP